MSDENQNPSTGSSSLVRKLLYVVAGLFVLLVIAYFVCTSSGFIKAVVLPKVGASLGAEVTADSVSLSPFSQISLHGLKVKTGSPEPLLEADDVLVRYSLFSILGGRIDLGEVKVASPKVHVVYKADGTSNLDPILKAQAAAPAGKTAAAAEPLKIAVRNVSLSQGTIIYENTLAAGGKQSGRISGLNMTLDRLENGQTGKLNAQAELAYEMRSASNQVDSIQGKLEAAYGFELTAALAPKSLDGSAKLQFTQGQGGYADAAQMALVLEGRMTPTEIQQMALRFEKGGAKLGQLRMSGPVDLTKLEGRLKIEVLALDRNVLNLAGTSHGWDFGDSIVNATNVVDFMDQARNLKLSGRVVGSQFAIKMQGQTTPVLGLDLDYAVDVDLTKSTALVRRLNLGATQAKGDLVRAALEQPMALAWGNAAANVKESQILLSVTNLNLADWGFLAGDLSPKGTIGMTGRIVSKMDGHQLSLEMEGQGAQVSARMGTNAVALERLNIKLLGHLEDFKTAKIDSYQFDLFEKANTVFTVNGSADYSVSDGDYSTKMVFEGQLLPVSRLVPGGVPAVITAGSFKGNALVSQRKGTLACSGSVMLSEFNGSYDVYRFEKYQAGAEFDVELKGSALKITRLVLSPRQGFEAGGVAEVHGTVDMSTMVAQLELALQGLNQNALGPIAAPYLTPRKLESIQIDMPSAKVAYNPAGAAAINAQIKVSNLKISDPSQPQTLPAIKLEARLDGQMEKQVLNLKELFLALEPTTRATNTVMVKGQLDMGKTNGFAGRFTVQADALDVTPVYQMWAASATNAPTQTNAPAAQTAAVETEPDAIKLPVDNIVVDKQIKLLFLGDIAITNLNTLVTVAGSKVTIKPCECTINGAPAKAEVALDLGVKGYTYDVSLLGDRIPSDPLIATFSPTNKGLYVGDLYVKVAVKGAGITGPSLQKNLSGETSLSFSNASIALISKRAHTLISPVATLLRVPELLDSPLTTVHSETKIGNGVVMVTNVVAEGPAFQARINGPITLAPVLTNSTLNLPVTLALSRAVAAKANLLAADTPTNAAYSDLPNFVKIGGTVGQFKPEFNELAIAGILGKNLIGLPGAVGEKIGSTLSSATNLLGGVTGSTNKLGGILSGILGGAKTNLTNTASTNVVTETNQVRTILKGLGGLFKTAPKTNTPPSN